MVNPHWDEKITEDIGFRGPHFNESIQETWSPQGEFGQHGEFEGWRSAEDPPSYTSDWQDYPADEFTGIQSNVPSGGGFLRNIFEKYGGNLGRLGGGLETPYGGGLLPWPNDDWGNKGRSLEEGELLHKRKYDKYLEFMNQNRNRFNPEPGPWNEFNPRSRYGTVGEADWGEDLMAELSDKQGNWMDSPTGSPDFYSNFGDYFDTVTGKGDWKQKLGWKDEATEQEVIDKLNQMMLDRQQSLPWSTT